MKNVTIAITAAVILTSCSTTRQVAVKRPASQLEMSISALFEGEEEEADNELYFYDSKGKSYMKGGRYGAEGIVDRTLLTMLDDIFENAMKRTRRERRTERLNVSIAMGEHENGYEYRGQLLSKAEEFVVSKKELKLQAQDEEVVNVVAKIIKKELDPFFSSNGREISGQTSDLILYIRNSFTGSKLTLKISVLTKGAEVLATKSVDMDLGKDQIGQLKWFNVHVPRNDNSGAVTYQIMESPVTEKEYKGFGSENRPVTNISYEEANNFCLSVYDGALLSSPYIFEFARRTRKLKRPRSPALEEMVAPLDLEDRDDVFFREGDHIQVNKEDVSTMIIFRWASERYYSISFTYKSPQMTFRCYR